MKRQVTKEKPYMANQILTQKLTNSQENAKHFSPIGQTKMKKTDNVQCWQQCGESGVDTNIFFKKPSPIIRDWAQLLWRGLFLQQQKSQ